MHASGYTQGTTYSVLYFNNGLDLQYQIDSLLLSFDRVLSTYQESSYISKWNRNEHVLLEQPARFKEVLKRATEVNDNTDGAFDITVSPLMNYWFAQDWNTSDIDSAMVDSLLGQIGMQNVVLEGVGYVKVNPNIKIDVNAIAQGYSVDVLARYLESLGIFNYLVEIGGEVRSRGSKPEEQSWLVGIDKPADENLERHLTMSVKLNNRSLATSGNYRKFVEINGQKFGHSLDPKTGYPAQTDILSATVLADDCMSADAYATALMVMGFEQSKALVEKEEALQAILIYSVGKKIQTWSSPSLAEFIVEQESE
jgi:thiamine biosynthesis lipoprotein